MLHEPLRAVGRQSTFLHAVQHGGVSCMGVTNPSLALSGHARQFRAETLCSAKRGKGKGVRGPLPHGSEGDTMKRATEGKEGYLPYGMVLQALVCAL